MKSLAYAIDSPTGKFHTHEIERREVGPDDVLINVLYCGICHTDIHIARSEWKKENYPVIPGHEIIGKVTKIGANVKNVKVGDNAGVGCLVDSCASCNNCNNHHEHCCPTMVQTYGSNLDGSTTYGGYSEQIVIKQHFVLKISEKFKNLAAVAPLLCAGITTYSPLFAYKEKVIGKKVGIIGLGGLGHVAVKIAVAMGAEVTVFSTSPSKKDDALKLGAKHFVVSKNADELAKIAGSFSFILNTVSANIDIHPYLAALEAYGALILVGAAPLPFSLSAFALIFGNKTVAGSLIGGLKETQEMLDFCAEKGILSEIEIISPKQIDEAFERTVKSDVKYRFVIDLNKK